MDEESSSLSEFSAVDATLGYLYQVRSALLWALRRLKTEPDFTVAVETLDDVAFETPLGEPTTLLQTKHHRTRTASLTDFSPDVWKTLRIWFEGHEHGEIPGTASLFLLTTASAAPNTAAYWLRSENRDVQKAQQALDTVAGTSTNKANKPGYSAYLRTSPNKRSAILERITVIDAAPSINDVDRELRQEVYWAVSKEYQEPFLQRLEGWWFRRVIQQLSGSPSERIGSVELEAKMADLREQFKQESLPIDEDLLQFTLDDEISSTYSGFRFVKQLDIIDAGKNRVAAAMRDYYRAYEQRSRWVREKLVGRLDLGKYEKRLSEEWELVFEAMRDELGTDATDIIKKKAARSILAWAEQTNITIRREVTEPFVCRGSFQMLSDEIKIGWHPEFRDLLSSLLEVEEGAA